jgi:hypothetical protein
MHQMYPAVTVTGQSGHPFLIRVENFDNQAKFTTGWAEFVAAERIMSGDIGKFTLSGLHRMIFLDERPRPGFT